MPGTAYARRPTSRRRRWERSRAHLGSKSAESRSIVLTRHSPGGYLLSGWEVSSHHGSDGSARKLKKAGEQRLAVSRSHSRRPHKILHTFMSSQAVDYDDLEATTNIEEITGDELNQNTLRSLKKDELSSLWLCARGLAPDVYEDGEYYELGSSKELGWLGHFMKKST
ncbi:hypothetical protein THAOC_21383, partial [Thalassiosira oceanica]